MGMILEGMTGEHLTMSQLEALTNFQPGKETWQFPAILAFASRGLHVRSIEKFYPEVFAEDVAECFRMQGYSQEIIDRQFQLTPSLPAEQQRVKECLANPLITFDVRLPELQDVQQAVQQGGMVMVNLNSAALNNRPGYAGHFVVVHDFVDGQFIVDDPGLPGQQNRQVNMATFDRAWKEPDESLANAVIVHAA